MRFYVGVTDDSWFEFLAARRPDEVNFWRPGGRGFHAIEPGAPFLFKLHAPNNFIVGGGFFVRHSILPLSLAWSAFAEKNGCASLADLRARILKLRRSAETDPHIGCTILTAPGRLLRPIWLCRRAMCWCWLGARSACCNWRRLACRYAPPKPAAQR